MCAWKTNKANVPKELMIDVLIEAWATKDINHLSRIE